MSQILQELFPWLAGMLVLVSLSGFFSCSEAALFYLKPAQRQQLAVGNRSQRIAARLLQKPEQLLSGILFFNLVVNVVYFSIGSMCSLHLERTEGAGGFAAVVFGTASLFVLVFLGEMLPKTVAVLIPMRLCQWVAIPLAFAIRFISFFTPVLERVNTISQRVIWPGLKAEPYLDSDDLEKAIEISGTDRAIVRQEQAALRNMVELSSIRVDEWMRPRTQFRVFRPPVSLADLDQRVPEGDYVLVAEPDNDEIAAAIRLDRFRELPETGLESLANPVVYLPWCSTVADALQNMNTDEREVTVIVNEYGETIGVLTIEDILESVFVYSPSRSKLLLDKNPLHIIDENRWVVAGIMSMRQLARRLNVEIPRTHSITVAGVIQETMQRMANVGDECTWGPFHFRVIDMAGLGCIAVELTLERREEDLQ